LHGGVQYEWSHRAIAGSIILLTISIAVWTFFAERRRADEMARYAAFER